MITKKVFITNGLSAYGRKIISVLVNSGCHLAFSYNSKIGPDEDFMNTLENKNHNSLILPYAIDDDANIHTLKTINHAADIMEGLDLLICIPELSDDIIDTPIATTKNVQLKRAFKYIYKDTILNLKDASLYMKEHNGGSIVIISDAKAFRAKKHDYLIGSMYAALHRSIESFTLQLAPYKIRVNCVAPGNVLLTNNYEAENENIKVRLPFNRFGTVDEIVEAVLFLGSDKASYITGTTLMCDGGSYLAGMPEKNDWYGWDNKIVKTE